jgi:hypothetical protein
MKTWHTCQDCGFTYYEHMFCDTCYRCKEIKGRQEIYELIKEVERLVEENKTLSEEYRLPA